ncbi:MAG: hypothetical protein H7267_09035 [Sandarakinorhabdus sp.]|nr:hypothetical protein [Sandarakinorhabdus sp.]
MRSKAGCNGLVAAALLGALPAAASAQLITATTPVGLTMAPSQLLAARQVYAIAPGQFLHELERQLTGAGIIVAPSREAARIDVEVTAYDSGPYLGFSKTARIAVNYRLQKPAGDAADCWSDRCEAKAGVDVQDAPDRNRTAVSLCLTQLGARLAEKLVGPVAEVLVN